MAEKAADITIQEYVKHFKNWKYSKIHHASDDSFSYVALDGSTVKVYYPEFGQGSDNEGWKARKAESRATIIKTKEILGGTGGSEVKRREGETTPVAEKKALLLNELEELNDQIIDLRNRRERLEIELDEIKAKNEALSGIDYEIIEISGVIRRIRQLISDEIMKMPRMTVSFKG